MTILGSDMASAVFTLFTPEELRTVTVLEITTPNCFDLLGHPLKGGLYDFAMGPSGSYLDACLTCKQGVRTCPGHFGHIELPVPVYNPIFLRDIYGLFRSACSSCGKIATPNRYKYLLIYQLKFLSSGHIIEAQELESVVQEVIQNFGPDEVDPVVRGKLAEFVNERGIDLNINATWTKTMEGLRRHFIDNYSKHLEGTKSCPLCKKSLKKIVLYQEKLVLPAGKIKPGDKYVDNVGGKDMSVGTVVILPEKVKSILKDLWTDERELIQELLPILRHASVPFPTDLLFMNMILVTPPKTRPVSYLGGRAYEGLQTRLYKEIVKCSIIVKNIVSVMKTKSETIPDDLKKMLDGIKGENLTAKVQNAWQDLQGSVNCLLNGDSRLNAAGVMGLKQIIEKKEGTFRKHMMGKRVNFAARSVIAPDPNLLIQEIGVPEYFAMKLTYPVKVNFFNVQELRKMVRNGPDVYPGATFVEGENGSLIRLGGGDKNKAKREGIAKLLLKSVELGGGKIVHRHLLNGDVLLLNRQPTLHRPSIMAHQVRVLKGEKTLRMHYSNCKSYNADFDGDEMNAHLPQSEMARSEAYNIVSVRNNYIVPKDGTPLGGLIQDHIISGVRLTMRGQFFDRKDYYQLVFQGLGHHRGNVKLLFPAILKPKVLWSGKQIISTILINIIPKGKELISMDSKAKIADRSWITGHRRKWKCGKKFKYDSEMSESEVIIRNGQLLCGVLDKVHYGATPYGLTHCLYELYGGNCSTKFLDSVGKLFTSYLQLNGFTLGVKDIIIQEKEDRERKRTIEELRSFGDTAAANALDLEEIPSDLTERLEKAYSTDRVKFKTRLDSEYKKLLDKYTNKINKVCVPGGLVTRFPENNLQLMVTSGAKGSAVNTMQISCLLGQIELEGKRPPWMISGKSLPCFKPFETIPRAGGYIDARFMTGITPQDFFFHCMAGREGLIDTAVKTARSGYLQRCLIKHLEGVFVAYDGTVRDHDGSVLQFAYGEDGLEVGKSTFLETKHMDFLYRNRNSVVDKSTLQVLKDSTNMKAIEKHKKKIKAWNEEWTDEKWRRRCANGFSVFSECIKNDIPKSLRKTLNKAKGRTEASLEIVKKWTELDEKSRNAYKTVPPDPVTSKFNRNRDFGVITESLENLITEYLESKSLRHTAVDVVRSIVSMKYMSSLCQPGEAVGLLAAQSIGEPSTQMTLNTFHFAGRGEMNVTLGIPRLREILMTASKNIKTPYMDVPIGTNNPETEQRGVYLKKCFRMVTLSDVLEKIEMSECLVTQPKMMMTYTLRFLFLSPSAYQYELKASPRVILKYMEKQFLLTLCKHLRLYGKRCGDQIVESKEEKLLSKSIGEGGEEEEGATKRKRSDSASSVESIAEDEDATVTRKRQEQLDHSESENAEEEENGESKPEDCVETEEVTGDNSNESIDEDRLDEELDFAQSKDDVELSYDQREALVLQTFPVVKNYKIDRVNEEWCEMVLGIPVSMGHIDFSTLLNKICTNSVIYSIPNVKRAIVYQNREGKLSLKTEGINLNELFKKGQGLDLNRLYTNDIHEVSMVYGIEAAARVIVRELKEVFGAYGIVVNPRHLTLIADYMTHQGFFSPFNRVGMVDSPSPLQQMTFESTVTFLKAAMSRSKTDNLNSPSARIMMGKYCMSGTGCFDLIVDRSKQQ